MMRSAVTDEASAALSDGGAPVLARVAHRVVARRGRVQDRGGHQRDQRDARQRDGDVEVLPVGDGHGGQRPAEGEDRLREPRHVQPRQRSATRGPGGRRRCATMGPTLHREPGSHHATIVRHRQQGDGEGADAVGHVPGGQGVAAAPAVRRVRGRVGGVDVITLPWSHMWALDEAGATRAGRLSRARGWDGVRGESRPRPRRWRLTRTRDCGALPLCGLIHAPTAMRARRGSAVEFRGTPDRYAPGSKLCRYERPSRRQAHSVRRALSSHARRRWRVKQVGAGAATQHRPPLSSQ